MPNWCLPPNLVDSFKGSILSGKINPEQLAEMSSTERRSLFEKELGKGHAEQINTEFEQKLLLKNRQQGYVNWARKILGETTPAGRDVISRVERMEKVLDAAEERAFLEDLASHKLGTHVSFNEAKQIADLSKKIDTAKTTMEAGGDRMAYGRAVVGLRNYVSELKHQAEKFHVSDLRQPTKALGKAVETTAGVAKSVKASLDDSAIFRQGWKTLWTNPLIWKRNALKTFSDIAKQIGGKNMIDEVDAEIVSRPTFDLMKRAKLDVGVLEESYPSRLPEKIPLLGRAFKASEAAYTGFVRRTRADVFDKMIDIAKKSGVELTTDELQSIGKMVNSLTGRGHLGRAEPAASVVNNVFFSPRFLKSQLDVLTHPLSGAGGSNFVRKQAALNLLKAVSGTAAILVIAKALAPDSVEFDPRSADFGKIKVRNTRFDVTGGMASLLTLAARLASMSAKSSTTGKISTFGLRAEGVPKFGEHTGKDVIYDFFENKLSPAASVMKDLYEGKDRHGKRPTVLGELSNLFEPMASSNYRELKNDPNSAPILLAMIADGLGASTNTYGPKGYERPNVSLPKMLPNETPEHLRMREQRITKSVDEALNKLEVTQEFRQLDDAGRKKAAQSLITATRQAAQKKIDAEDGVRKRFRVSDPTQRIRRRIVSESVQ
mgnify:CR=1 FL=1